MGVPHENYHFQGLYHEIFELSQIQGAICRLHELGRLPVADAPKRAALSPMLRCLYFISRVEALHPKPNSGFLSRGCHMEVKDKMIMHAIVSREKVCVCACVSVCVFACMFVCFCVCVLVCVPFSTELSRV